MPKSSTGTATTAESSHDPAGTAPRVQPGYCGRFAPSPTGPLHFGSMLAAVGSWLDARSCGGRWLLRIEDLDPPREPPGAAEAIVRALEAFELHWDGPLLFQSQRVAAYEAALEHLREAGWAYPCACSRKEIEAENLRRGRPEARSYPGTCRERPLPSGHATRIVRVRVDAGWLSLEDRLQGAFGQHLEAEVGDFVIRRREGYIAYQLAVVVDDADHGITDVVRGIDLLDSTPRQLWLQALLKLPAPRYMHLPVVVRADGEKLSKQTGAAPINPADAADTAWRILHELRQAPPPELRGAAPHELWAWALPRWNPQHLAGTRSIEAR